MNPRRRDFITLLGGAAAAWPLAARAQQPNRMRRLGVMMYLAADDPEAIARVGAFLQGLQQLGWTLGQNLRIDYRWGAAEAPRVRQYAAELIALAPDVILAEGGTIVRELQQASTTVPIVFASATDPVSGGLVESLAHPGRNTTGFATLEYGTSPKYLELMRQVAPRVTRVAVIRDPTGVAGGGQLGAIQGVAPALGIEVSSVDAREPAGIERAIGAFAQKANGGLIAAAGRFVAIYRELIIALAARHGLPAIYAGRAFVAAGGLASYGANETDLYRQAASYVDRILKGEKPANLPVQTPTKLELVINLKTAKALGLTVPATLLAVADEVIE
jgi:putative ABC transport system substrate-binding protein